MSCTVTALPYSLLYIIRHFPAPAVGGMGYMPFHPLLKGGFGRHPVVLMPLPVGFYRCFFHVL